MKPEFQDCKELKSLVELSRVSGGKEEAPEAYSKCVEEADDAANKDSRMKASLLLLNLRISLLFQDKLVNRFLG